MKASVRESLERLMKRRIRHRDGSKISTKEASGLAKLAVLMHDSKVDYETALSGSIARHPAGNQLAPQPVILPTDLACMGCNDNEPLPGRIWCTTCAEIVDSIDTEQDAK